MSYPQLLVRKYCAGNCNVVPYKVSAAEHFNSFFTVVRSPRGISGRCFNYLVLVNSTRREAFKLMCSLSTMPFAWRWYAVVWMFLVPKSCDNLRNSSDSNWRPRSVVILSGTPYLATHPARNVLDVVYADISGIGNASHHWENLPTHVNRYDCSSRMGSCPVMWMWMCLNLSSDARNSSTGAWVCQLTLTLWHFRHIFVHALTSVLIHGQINLSVNKLMDTLAPEYGNLCIEVKMSLHKDADTNERYLALFCALGVADLH